MSDLHVLHAVRHMLQSERFDLLQLLPKHFLLLLDKLQFLLRSQTRDLSQTASLLEIDLWSLNLFAQVCLANTHIFSLLLLNETANRFLQFHFGSIWWNHRGPILLEKTLLAVAQVLELNVLYVDFSLFCGC